MDEAPAVLRTRLAAIGLTDDTTPWQRLTGGYHNDVFRAGQLVVKHYVAGSTNPMFPQLPADEHRALVHLHTRGAAPEPVAFLDDVDGRSLLVYRYVDGDMWQHGTERVGRLLATVHGSPPDHPWRTGAPSARHATEHARSMLAACPPSAERTVLDDLLATTADAPAPSRPGLIHTDCGPGNLVDTGDRLVLIDWQCPALGDPVEDLANFTSAAIQILYQRPPLGASEEAALLSAYGDTDPEPPERFPHARWAFHARLAAYCCYRRHELADLQPDVSDRYHRALRAELQLLTHREPIG